jgi:alpha-galactosidase
MNIKTMKKTFLIIPLIICAYLQAQKFEKLALTPPMGWNSWNTFKCNISEPLVKDIVDRFIADGYKDAGYRYVNIDDCWMAMERDSLGNLVADSEKFPGGIKALADYIHSKGLKFGVYGCAGNKTCAGYPGNRGHEYQDALSYASWGVDYLKYDWCNTGNMNAEEAYKTMRDALFAAKRPVVFSLCEWGNNQPWEWGKDVGHLWRISGDIDVCFDCEVNHGTWSSWGVMRVVYMREGIRGYSGPDHWNDFDMMEVGNGMTVSEDRAHFSLWCMLASPLVMGHDLREATKETIEILTNKEVIAVNQDSLGIQAFKYSDKDSIEVWAKPLYKGDWAICFLNRNSEKYKIEFDWNEHHIVDNIAGREITFDKDIYKIRDLWLKKERGNTKKILTAEIPCHDVLLLRLTKE